jgi:hypothetical protein
MFLITLPPTQATLLAHLGYLYEGIDCHCIKGLSFIGEEIILSENDY